MSESARVSYMRLVLFFDLPVETAAGAAIARVRKNRPPAGLVQILKVTESQFAMMDYITGNREAYDEVDTMEELLIL